MKSDKIISLLLAVILLLSVCCTAPVSAETADAIPYVDAAGEPMEPITEFTVVDKNTRDLSGRTYLEEYEEEHWYVVTDDVELNDRITVNGVVNLILCSGATLIAHKGISVNDSFDQIIPAMVEGNTLIIWQQEATDSLPAGKLIIDSPVGFQAGIGGEGDQSCGTVIINGGFLDVTGGRGSLWADGAGIGGGCQGSGGNITINGGTVNATGGEWGAAGIGGGYGGSGGNITINGGSVNAYSSENSSAAGIGGGENGDSGGNITINGGIVNAVSRSGHADIGGGNHSPGGVITINGGTVTAENYGIGFGGRDEDEEATVITLDWTDTSKDTMSIFAYSYRGTVKLLKPFRYDEPWDSGIIEAADDADMSKLGGKTLKPYKRPIPSTYDLDLPETITLSSGAEWTTVSAAVTAFDLHPNDDDQLPDQLQIEYVGGTLTSTSDSSQTLLFDMGYTDYTNNHRNNIYFNLSDPGETRFRIHISPADYNMAPFGTYTGVMTVITRWRYGRETVKIETVTVPVSLNATGGIPGSTPVVLLGDADGNGEVDIIDATVIQRYDVCLTDLSDYAKTRADVDGDSEIDIIDATWIQRWDAGMTAPDGIGKQMESY